MGDEHLIAAYESARSDVHKSVELHAQHFWQFLTLLVAILTLTFAGMGWLPDNVSKAIVLLLGGATGVLVAICGRAMCNRFYEGMLEAIAMSAKVEAALGLDSRPASTASTFPEDKAILPPRWIAHRSRYTSSEHFVRDSMNQGANRVVTVTFAILGSINALVVLYGAYSLLRGNGLMNDAADAAGRGHAPWLSDQRQDQGDHAQAPPGREVGGCAQRSTSAPSIAPLRTFGAPASTTSSGAFPRQSSGGPQAPWPNHVLQPTPWIALAFPSPLVRRG